MTFGSKSLALGIAATLLLSASPSWASAQTIPEANTAPNAEQRKEDKGHDGPFGHGHGRHHDEQHQLKRLQYVARYFDIKTEGKDSKQLYEEIQAAKKANPQKWEAFKAEHKAKFEERLKDAARYFGIATEGKSVEQLHKELKAAREKNPDKWRAYIMEKRAQFDADKGADQRRNDTDDKQKSTSKEGSAT
ncbi:hypothetical protein PCCS19_54040 [Paenibacillus sp. CCS19]|uniref:hypothetical protein n=1 Tax=Paenibacillus sp. CCS19 TaxID=3158387 RepID=UPI0025667DBB|nr:hypothetical protein [Paenibacillus cellulosilyticus]GMK42345.1 hypothetical protein PCCS19_54040 [Paenibacillus cellulosilyticus]